VSAFCAEIAAAHRVPLLLGQRRPERQCDNRGNCRGGKADPQGEPDDAREFSRPEHGQDIITHQNQIPRQVDPHKGGVSTQLGRLPSPSARSLKGQSSSFVDRRSKLRLATNRSRAGARILRPPHSASTAHASPASETLTESSRSSKWPAAAKFDPRTNPLSRDWSARDGLSVSGRSKR